MTSAYICPRSRNTGRSTRNPRNTTSPKTASATTVRRVTRGLRRSITVKASEAVSRPPASSMRPVPTRFRNASTSFMIRDTRSPVLFASWNAIGSRPTRLLDPDPHVGDQLLRRLRDELHQGERAEALHDGGGHDGPDQGQEQLDLAAADDVVDQVLGGGGQDEPRHPAHRHEQEGHGQQPPPGLHEGPDIPSSARSRSGFSAPRGLPGQPRHDPSGSPHRGILPRRTRGAGFTGPSRATDETRSTRAHARVGVTRREFVSDAPPSVPCPARPHGPPGVSR